MAPSKILERYQKRYVPWEKSLLSRLFVILTPALY